MIVVPATEQVDGCGNTDRGQGPGLGMPADCAAVADLTPSPIDMTCSGPVRLTDRIAAFCSFMARVPDAENELLVDLYRSRAASVEFGAEIRRKFDFQRAGDVQQ